MKPDWKPHDFRSFVRDWDESAYHYAVITTHKLFLLHLDGKLDPTGRLTTWNGLKLFIAVAHTYHQEDTPATSAVLARALRHQQPTTTRTTIAADPTGAFSLAVEARDKCLFRKAVAHICGLPTARYAALIARLTALSSSSSSADQPARQVQHAGLHARALTAAAIHALATHRDRFHKMLAAANSALLDFLDRIDEGSGSGSGSGSGIVVASSCYSSFDRARLIDRWFAATLRSLLASYQDNDRRLQPGYGFAYRLLARPRLLRRCYYASSRSRRWGEAAPRRWQRSRESWPGPGPGPGLQSGGEDGGDGDGDGDGDGWLKGDGEDDGEREEVELVLERRRAAAARIVHVHGLVADPCGVYGGEAESAHDSLVCVDVGGSVMPWGEGEGEGGGGGEGGDG
ncbi:hypothetical protein SLS55_010105 [Diplodia seriata]|uniref:Uncharacterized protein n=1 Tax=Diplodia seriata TaxID=420778 RepID=A0ABR3C2P7_9PEZI